MRMNRIILLRLRTLAHRRPLHGYAVCPSCAQRTVFGLDGHLYSVSTNAALKFPKPSPLTSSSTRPAAAPVPVSRPVNEESFDVEQLLRDLKARHGSGKQFYETENEGIRQALLRLPPYKTYFGSLPLKIGTSPPSIAASREMMLSANSMDVRQLVELTTRFSIYLSLGRDQLVKDPLFLDFVKNLSRKLLSCSDLTFLELQSLLQCYQRFRFDQLAHDFEPAGVMRSALDAQCLEMWPRLTANQAFILSDLWFLSSCSRLAEFPKHLLSKIKPQVTFFKPEELVRLLFALSLQRTADPGLMLLIERVLLPHIPNYSAEEIAAVCAGFFKTQTTPGAELVDKLLTRLLNMDRDDLSNDIVITLCCKFASRYAVSSHHDQLKSFVAKMKPLVEQLSITTLAHLCGLLETVQTVDKEFLNLVCMRVGSQLPSSRLKDIAKICEICSFFDFRPDINGKDFYTVLLDSLRKNLGFGEIALYPSKFVVLLASLARLGIFSNELLKKMSTPAFFRIYLDQPRPLLVNKELLQLHYAVELDFAERQQPVLPSSLALELVKNESPRSAEQHSAISSLLIGLRTLLQQETQGHIRGSVAVSYALPYAQQVMLVRINDMRSMPLPSDLLSDDSPHLLKEAPKDGTCFALVYHPWWEYFGPGHELNGLEAMKLRHLQKLGYRTISVDQQEIQNYNFVQKMKYLRDKLFFNDFGAHLAPAVESHVQSLTGGEMAQSNL